jgi:hypothetical protein
MRPIVVLRKRFYKKKMVLKSKEIPRTYDNNFVQEN